MYDIISIGSDFMEAVYVYMTEKYIIYILEELGFIKKEPTHTHTHTHTHVPMFMEIGRAS